MCNNVLIDAFRIDPSTLYIDRHPSVTLLSRADSSLITPESSARSSNAASPDFSKLATVVGVPDAERICSFVKFVKNLELDDRVKVDM